MDDPIDTNIDLNQHPVADPSPESQSFETPQNGIQDRFRALEAVNSVRVRRPQRVVDDPVSSLNSDIKRDVSYLEKALEMNLDDVSENKRIGDSEKGNYFDCNVCLSMARDPVLTCCGHLFCWGCFYKVPYVDSISKECPACKGEVIDSNVVPIYGDGNEKGMGKRALELDSGVMIPPRPRARRVESVRQENFGQGVHHVMMANAVRRIRVGLGTVQEIGPSQSVNSLGSTSNADANREARQFSGSGPMISSSASPWNRYMDLDTHISNGPQAFYQDRVTSVFNASVSIQTVFQRNVAATTVVHSGTLPTNGSVDIDVTISGPRRRRIRRRGVSPALNLEGESSLEYRRQLRLLTVYLFTELTHERWKVDSVDKDSACCKLVMPTF